MGDEDKFNFNSFIADEVAAMKDFDALIADEVAAENARWDRLVTKIASVDESVSRVRNELVEFIEQKTRRPKKIRAPSGKIYEIMDD